jgi:hypothetical protein
MKTSNKIITAATICLVLAIVAYTFIMRGAYQEALKNPVSWEVKIGLKPVKYLNITYDDNINFKRGNKFEIIVDRPYKDSLNTAYKDESLDLDISKLGAVTIFLPDFPEMNFIRKSKINQGGFVLQESNSVAYESHEERKGIMIDSTFQSGNFVATFQDAINLNFYKNQFYKIDVKGKENISLTIDNSQVKQLNVDLKKKSNLVINYSIVESKNLILDDDCSVNVIGKEARATFLK